VTPSSSIGRYLLPSIWTQLVPNKRWYLSRKLRGVTGHKTIVLTVGIRDQPTLQSLRTIITNRAKQQHSVRGQCFRHGLCIQCNKDFPYWERQISYISYWTLCPTAIRLHLSPTPHAHSDHIFIDPLFFTVTKFTVSI
jgi:hypothetical protein